jgi:sugar diacid utilization regulator
MRDIHTRMLGAVLDGEGLRGLTELAAAEAGGPVAIVLPARGLAAASSDEVALEPLSALAAKRIAKGASSGGPRTDDVIAERAVEAGAETIGYVLALRSSTNGVPELELDREEVLRSAALACLTEVAVADARDELASEVRGTLLEDVRAGRASSDDILRRGARAGCDLSRGAVAVVAEIHSSRPRHAAALISSSHPGAVAELLPAPARSNTAVAEDASPRVYAILPAPDAEDPGDAVLASARDLLRRLRPHGVAASSSFCSDPGELGRAISEAELALDVIGRDERMADQLERGIGGGVYRLLLRALASEPDEVYRFYEDTVEPLVEHDRRYHTDLLATLEAYLASDYNMNATARTIYAHRHTVAHRLGRVKELTGLDPGVGEDRERLGLGVKAYRILAPTLPG